MALTGSAAVEAVQAMMMAGNANARFDGPRVVKALKLGRSRLVIAGIRLGRGVPLPGSVARFVAGRGPSRVSRRSRRVTARSSGSRGEPREPSPAGAPCR